MTGTANLTSLATTAGRAHGVLVGSLLRGSRKPARSTAPPMDKPLAELRDAAGISKQDFEQLAQIVRLANTKPTKTQPDPLQQIRDLDEALQRKAKSVHPLVLAISSIASDSASTALKAKAPATNGTKSKRQDSKSVSLGAVVVADIAGAVLGGIAMSKVSNDTVDIMIGAAIGAVFSSQQVAGGHPFPVFD